MSKVGFAVSLDNPDLDRWSVLGKTINWDDANRRDYDTTARLIFDFGANPTAAQMDKVFGELRRVVDEEWRKQRDIATRDANAKSREEFMATIDDRIAGWQKNGMPADIKARLQKYFAEHPNG